MNRVRVGIAEFGTVGRATADIISAHGDLIAQRSGVRLEVTAVCRRSVRENRRYSRECSRGFRVK